jgi:hypothetical protein
MERGESEEIFIVRAMLNFVSCLFLLSFLYHFQYYISVVIPLPRPILRSQSWKSINSKTRLKCLVH